MEIKIRETYKSTKRSMYKLKSSILKKIFIAVFSLCLFGCNMNPSKEARIQKLETEIQETMDKINKLEVKFQTLEVENEQLRTRVLVLEKQ